MLSDERLAEIRNTVSKASPAPWEWSNTIVEEPTNDPTLLSMGIQTEPAGFENMQLVANGNHRFWVELTDTQIAGDVVFDLDFIQEARDFVPELLAEIERLRGLLGRGAQ
jgi:hypothetical protein